MSKIIFADFNKICVAGITRSPEMSSVSIAERKDLLYCYGCAALVSDDQGDGCIDYRCDLQGGAVVGRISNRDEPPQEPKRCGDYQTGGH